MNEYTHEQIIAVEEFAKGLRECFSNKSDSANPLSKAVMWYVLQTLDIHVSLAQLKFERYVNNHQTAVMHG